MWSDELVFLLLTSASPAGPSFSRELRPSANWALDGSAATSRTASGETAEMIRSTESALSALSSRSRCAPTHLCSAETAAS